MRTIFCLFKNKWQWGKVVHSYNPSTSEEEKESGVQGTSDTLGIQNQSWLHETLSKKIQNQSTNHSPHNFKFLYNS